jgi:D-alanyl-D-alanine carboxypeptidase
MASLTEPGGPPGVITVIQSGSDRREIGVGVANTSTNQPMTGDATMRIASISKAFNGAVILSLVASGKLALSDTVAQLLPTAPASWGKVTLAQVLQHTSGLPDYIKSPVFVKELIANPQMQRTPEQLLGYVADQPPAFPAGTEYLYSDTDNIVAGLIAEKATGKPYQDLVSSLVADPLKLSETELPATSAMPDGFIHGYEPAEEVAPAATEATGAAAGSAGASAPTGPTDVSELINPGLAWASGGMISTPFDLNTFFRAYATGQLTTPAVHQAQLQFVPGGGGPPGPGANSSGLSIYRYVTPCGTVYGHTGNMPGYTLFAASTPDGTRSVVVAANSQISSKGDNPTFKKLLAVQNAAICSATGQTPSSDSSASSSQ